MFYLSLPPLEQQPDLIIPVPLHDNRLKSRGFNQAEEIARYLGKKLQIPIANKRCRRIKDTPTQTGLTAAERRKNLRGAFQMKHSLEGQHIVIIDDVMTTGQTMLEVAKAARASGAKTIDLWAISRAVLRN